MHVHIRNETSMHHHSTTVIAWRLAQN